MKTMLYSREVGMMKQIRIVGSFSSSRIADNVSSQNKQYTEKRDAQDVKWFAAICMPKSTTARPSIK